MLNSFAGDAELLARPVGFDMEGSTASAKIPAKSVESARGRTKYMLQDYLQRYSGTFFCT